MKLSELMLFGLLLVPTLVVVAAAVISLVTPEPDPQYRAPAVAAAAP